MAAQFTQLTLGELIDLLTVLPSDHMISPLTNPHSYRGYYSDLAFEPPFDEEEVMTVEEALQVCDHCLLNTFTGWKGGDFRFDRDTRLWVSTPGSCSGQMVTGLDVRGHLITHLDEFH